MLRFLLSLVLVALVFSESISAKTYQLGAIQGLIEQEVGKKILPKVYQRLGFNVEVKSLPANKVENLLYLGFIDGEIMRIESYGDNNDRVIRVPTPYYQLQTMAFVNKNRKIPIKSIKDLQGLKVAVVKGVKHTENATKGLESVVALTNTKQILKLVDKGRVDVALTNTIDGLVAIERLSLNNVVSLDQPLATEPLYHYLHKSNEALVPKVDNQIKMMKESGELAVLIRQAELAATAGSK
ncbi:transporter substrate-binding domain-containing protein [Psychrosphaera ytuae]|uniref:Transporter substrate-binding domain-containing protein n=1 Tax=Psychrosphaera ytuae TaxID=2820710 RepID=A0A975DBB8_9GAMM|nr:transporter substrate-binding domain-containing protein [Psychrosphaera ytuae]QTH64012.1 transporter substrate-binding domain-containing protein [Psychrosphaera ytuae]